MKYLTAGIIIGLIIIVVFWITNQFLDSPGDYPLMRVDLDAMPAGSTAGYLTDHAHTSQ